MAEKDTVFDPANFNPNVDTIISDGITTVKPTKFDQNPTLIDESSSVPPTVRGVPRANNIKTTTKKTNTKKGNPKKQKKPDVTDPVPEDFDVNETVLDDPNTKLKDGKHHRSEELPDELQGRYTYTSSKENFFTNGAEANTYKCKRISDDADVVIKVYNEGRSANVDVLEKLQQISKGNKSEYLSHLPEVIEFANGYEVLEFINGKDLASK
jgi:hypothetical protein